MCYLCIRLLFVYTVEAFLMFEKGFINGVAYNYKAVESSSCAMSFEVWGVRVARESYREELYEFLHIVTFNKEQVVVECTCKIFIVVEILCSHCLRVLHACCVEQVLDQYKTRGWCKGIKDGQNLDLGKSAGKEHMGCSSVWIMQMMRKMNSIVIASQMNKNAKAHCEKYFMELKELIEFDVRSIHGDKDGEGKDLNSLPNVLNLPGSLQKWVRNKRFNSIIEKKCDQVKWRKIKKLLKTDGSFPLMSFHLTYYFHPSNDSSMFMPITALPVLQQFHTDNFHTNATHNDKH
ncbi:hypothetical protein Cgig2_002677 [Carnegiea gigantea]|uniref:SWIM-type domain-containing protein n=1 Tax=Carnegiea gigantea TaxID=171969 RepID=A0A9Q1QCE6_9CARY|nr:hypothetical protein Cgig2_002677 [Carnegiea gigantea]